MAADGQLGAFFASVATEAAPAPAPAPAPASSSTFEVESGFQAEDIDDT
eukprot:COSAG04_NODE_2808_length_3547_cov_78.428944_5_plen_48_part_01